MIGCCVVYCLIPPVHWLWQSVKENTSCVTMWTSEGIFQERLTSSPRCSADKPCVFFFNYLCRLMLKRAFFVNNPGSLFLCPPLVETNSVIQHWFLIRSLFMDCWKSLPAMSKRMSLRQSTYSLKKWSQNCKDCF